jgi:hypothetical protein
MSPKDEEKNVYLLRSGQSFMVGYGSGQKKGVSDNTDDKNLYV